MTRLPDYVTNAVINDLIKRSLEEDVGSGDVTTLATVPQDRTATARLDVRQPGVAAGVWMASYVFETVNSSLKVDWRAGDGDRISAGSVLGVVKGPARSILTAERLALNLIQRMSGIATMTRQMVDLASPYGATILDTRKTAPGLRAIDKWAVKIGGGENHRIGLFDMILIKDNHIASTGGIEQAVRSAIAFQEREGRKLKIEVELGTMDDIEEVLRLEGIDVVLLDNMVDVGPDGTVDASRLAAAVERIDGRIRTEASGNVTLQTVETIAQTGVNYISCGALTHSVRALDIGLNIQLDS